MKIEAFKNLVISVICFAASRFLSRIDHVVHPWLQDAHSQPDGSSRASGPLTVPLLPVMIPPVRSDPVAWNCIECNGHREFPVSSDKWPGPGSGSADSGAVWLITPAADTNTATGFDCRLLHYPHCLQHAHVVLPLSLSAFFFSMFQAKGCKFHPANVSKCKRHPYSACIVILFAQLLTCRQIPNAPFACADGCLHQKNSDKLRLCSKKKPLHI